MAKNKTQRDKVEVDDATRLLRRAKYLLSKIKKEQNLLDAYCGEGWKGHSREKNRPEKELERANKQIQEAKLSIREVISEVDSLNEVGNNNSKVSECKGEMLESINAYLGTQFSLDTAWQDVFKEEAAISEGGDAMHNIEEEWPSDDSEDEDYDPDMKEDSSNSINTDQENMEGDSNSVCSSNGCIDSEELASGCRQRKVIDYKKLHEEMFGKDASFCDEFSEDDQDWGPTKTRMKDEVLESKVSKNGKNVTGKENMKKKRPQKRPALRDISNKDSMEVSGGVSLGDSQNAKVN